MNSKNSLEEMILQSNPAAVVEELRPQIDEAVARVLDSGRYILGSEDEKFEYEWATWCEVDHAVGCANGTDGIELILRSLRLDPKSRVLAPSHTAVATIAGIVRAGFRPYLADIDPVTYTLIQEVLNAYRVISMKVTQSRL